MSQTDTILDTRGADLFDRWELCTGPSLRGHIVNDHMLNPALLRVLGINYDVELAEFRGFGLGWVAERAIEILSLPKREIRDLINSEVVLTDVRISTGEYRHLIAQTIRYIGDRSLANIPLERVSKVFPGFEEVQLDQTPTLDPGFYATEGDQFPIEQHHFGGFIDSATGIAAYDISQGMPMDRADFQVRLSPAPALSLERK